MTRKQTIYEFLRKMKNQHGMDAVYTTEEIADAVGFGRANVSSDLNRLFEEELVEKIPGWPVRYRASVAVLTPMPDKSAAGGNVLGADSVFENFIGCNGSMSMEIEKAKAAVLYPLSGIPMLIEGQTGAGKTTFARLMYEYAKKAGRLREDAKFISFNCADYAHNPQLIIAQLFGYARGAFTGADDERVGLVEQADNGVLFLDEAHRLPGTAQEMLFSLMDFGQYRRLGEADVPRVSHPIIIMATTENKDSALLATFNRRVPIAVSLPPLAQRSPLERLNLIKQLFFLEAQRLRRDLQVDAIAVKALLAYDCPGNVGQLENDIKVACARAYVNCLMGSGGHIHIGILQLPLHVKEGIRKIREIYSDINLISGDLEIRLGEGEGCGAEVLGRSNIYDILADRHEEYVKSNVDRDYIELAMMMDVEGYFQDLMLGRTQEGEAILDYLSEQALDMAKESGIVIKRMLGIRLQEQHRIALAFHFSGVISRMAAGKPIVCPVLSYVRRDHAEVFRAAEEIVKVLRERYAPAVPDDEAGLIANLLLRIAEDGAERLRCGMLVICRGLGGARTMAKVANGIVGREYVQYLDVTELETEEELRQKIECRLAQMTEYGGVAVMADAGLRPICRGLREGDKSVAVMDDISTSAVIEAALLAVEHRATAEQIRRHLKQLAPGYREAGAPDAARPPAAGEKYAIVTACISGCGAAVKLKNMIEQKFSLPEDIEIVTMDISSVESLRDRLTELASAREIICIVGMDVGLDMGYPFLSVEEFVLGNGIGRLTEILRNYHIGKRAGEPAGDARESGLEATFFSGRHMKSYLFYLDGEKIMPYLNEFVNKLESARGRLGTPKRLMLFIHLCSMVERLIFENRGGTPARRAAADMVRAMEPLEAVFRIVVPDEEYDMLEQIMELTLNK